MIKVTDLEMGNYPEMSTGTPSNHKNPSKQRLFSVVRDDVSVTGERDST